VEFEEVYYQIRQRQFENLHRYDFLQSLRLQIHHLFHYHMVQMNLMEKNFHLRGS
jgi:hypothetical protein